VQVGTIAVNNALDRPVIKNAKENRIDFVLKRLLIKQQLVI
jgi:hypothetical protein